MGNRGIEDLKKAPRKGPGIAKLEKMRLKKYLGLRVGNRGFEDLKRAPRKGPGRAPRKGPGIAKLEKMRLMKDLSSHARHLNQGPPVLSYPFSPPATTTHFHPSVLMGMKGKAPVGFASGDYQTPTRSALIPNVNRSPLNLDLKLSSGPSVHGSNLEYQRATKPPLNFELKIGAGPSVYKRATEPPLNVELKLSPGYGSNLEAQSDMETHFVILENDGYAGNKSEKLNITGSSSARNIEELDLELRL